MINPSLDQITIALEKISNPQDCFKSIMVAGTNGKGSVATFLELLYCHYFPKKKIAKYISPPLVNDTERISVNLKEITNDDFAALKEQYFSEDLTEFENLTLVAFEYFKRQKVDIAILEAGLGGRWDATNVIKPENRLATVITNIGWDHMDYLGDSLEKIRAEKEAIKRVSVSHFEGEKIYATDKNPNSPNGVNFLLAIEIFEKLNEISINENSKIKILESFKSRYRGRFSYDNRKHILIDGSHNVNGATQLNAYIKDLKLDSKTKILVLAFLDKEISKIIPELFREIFDPERDLIICSELNSSRTTKANVLAELIRANSPKANIKIIPNPQEAIKTAFQLQEDKELIITGSLSLIGEYYKILEDATLTA